LTLFQDLLIFLLLNSYQDLCVSLCIISHCLTSFLSGDLAYGGVTAFETNVCCAPTQLQLIECYEITLRNSFESLTTHLSTLISQCPILSSLTMGLTFWTHFQIFCTLHICLQLLGTLPFLKHSKHLNYSVQPFSLSFSFTE
jgi:hypothetical protein